MNTKVKGDEELQVYEITFKKDGQLLKDKTRVVVKEFSDLYKDIKEFTYDGVIVVNVKLIKEDVYLSLNLIK